MPINVRVQNRSREAVSACAFRFRNKTAPPAPDLHPQPAGFASLIVAHILAHAPRPAPSTVSLPLPPAGFASLIVAHFLARFAELRGKRFTLQWRGSRNGFGVGHFHGRCDGYAPTLALNQDTDGNIVGGFMPVELDSRERNRVGGSEDDCLMADLSLNSFVFTMMNPHNFVKTQTPTVTVGLAALTPTTPAWT